MRPSAGKLSTPANGVSLSQVVGALAPILPADRRQPVEVETIFAYEALLARGWPGYMVSRKARTNPLSPRAPWVLHYCLRLGSQTANARGEDFSQIWVNGQPPGAIAFDLSEVATMRCHPSFAPLRSAYPGVYAAVSELIEALARSRQSCAKLQDHTPTQGLIPAPARL